MRRISLIATAVPFALGCGAIKNNQLPDAPNGDSPAAHDSGPDAEVAGSASVLVYDQDSGVTLAAAKVVFIDSAQTQVTTTDSDGVAVATVLPGATATAVVPDGTDTTEMITVTGVQPGDQITIGSPASTPTTLGTLIVTYPGNPIGAAAELSFAVYTSCGEMPTGTSGVVGSASLAITSDCNVSPMDIVVIESNTSGQIGFLEKSTAVTYSGGSDTVAFTGSYKSFSTFAAGYTDIASDVSSIGLVRFDVDQGEQLSENTSGTPSTSGTLSLNVPASLTTSGAVIESDFAQTGFGNQEVVQKVDGNATSYGLDVSHNLLPWLGDVTFDPSTATLSTTSSTIGTGSGTPDLFAAFTEYERAPATDGGTTQFFEWLVFEPDFTESIVLPTLPIEVGDVNPKPTDIGQNGNAEIFDSDQVSGYSQAHLDPFGYAVPFETLRGITRLRESDTARRDGARVHVRRDRRRPFGP